MEYTILILLLPFVSFLLLGLAGMKLRPVVAGAIGTAVLAVAMSASRKDRPNTGAYWSMEVKLPRVKLPSRVVTA